MMRKLQGSILYLLIHLVILFNIERLDIDGKNVINLATAIYGLTVIAVIMILSIRGLRKLPQPILIGFWAIVYCTMKLMLLSQRPLLGDIYTYLSFTELGFFLIAVILAQRLGLNLEEFEQNAKQFALANFYTLKRMQDAQADIEAEIYRSRRFHRPLAVIVLEKDGSKLQTNIGETVQDAQRSLVEHYVSAMMIREISAQLRQTDILLEHDKKDRFIIISPDTDDEGTKAFIQRLRSLARNELFSLTFGAATFPNHALTFEELLERAESNLQQQIDGQISMDTPLDSPKEVQVG